MLPPTFMSIYDYKFWSPFHQKNKKKLWSLYLGFQEKQNNWVVLFKAYHYYHIMCQSFIYMEGRAFIFLFRVHLNDFIFIDLFCLTQKEFNCTFYIYIYIYHKDVGHSISIWRCKTHDMLNFSIELLKWCIIRYCNCKKFKIVL